jgi:integrase
MKTKNKVKLPKGLWVGKVRKPAKSWADAGVPEYYDSFYAKYQRANGAQFMQSLDTTVHTEAISRAKLLVVARESDKWETLRAAVEGTRARRDGLTLGAFLAAFEKVAAARGLKEYKRACSAARLVAAIANGIIEPLSNTRMDTDGGRLLREVDGLGFAEVFTERTVLEYARRMQGGEVINLDKSLPPLVNGTINSTLGNARVLLSQQNRVLDVAALKVNWAATEGFMRLRLPELTKDVGADIPTTVQFKAMFASWLALEDEDLALCNELLRLLGLRSGELVMARESWLHEGGDGRLFMWVKNRAEEGFSCKSTNQAKLPLTEDLARRLKLRCAAARSAGIGNPFLILPMSPGADVLGEEQKDRRALVRERHNAWLKTFIGEVRSGQGNHRLRKYCATALYAAELVDHGSHERAARAVMEYLRHSKEATALVHYIARNDELLRTMTDDMLQRARAA